MIKFILYLPVHLYNIVLAHTPRAVFIAGYEPSSEAVRNGIQIAKNNARWVKYNLTK